VQNLNSEKNMYFPKNFSWKQRKAMSLKNDHVIVSIIGLSIHEGRFEEVLI
jgi:hypothetical protein